MRRTTQLMVVCALSAAVFTGCRRSAAPDDATAADSGKSKQSGLLVFPERVRVDDPAVNEFVTRAMTVCAGGKYEDFRLLWSAKENPLPRAEFEEGWNAVQRIEVRALEKGMLEADPAAGREAPQLVYALLLDVSFDPALRAGQKEPLRHVVLMLVQENEQWRLAKAPKAMREWIKKKAEEAQTAGDSGMAPPPSPPAGP